MESIRVNKDLGRTLDNICDQILHIKTPEDRLRAAISSFMLVASFTKPKGKTAKNGMYHLYHLLNVLMQDVDALQWSHPLEGLEEEQEQEDKDIYEEVDGISDSDADSRDNSESEEESEEGTGECSERRSVSGSERSNRSRSGEESGREENPEDEADLESKESSEANEALSRAIEEGKYRLHVN